MGIPQYYRNILKDIRADVKYDTFALWTLTTTVNSNDAYAEPTLSSGSRFFTGSIAWGSTNQYGQVVAGYHETGRCVIIASKDEKSYVDVENVYIVAEGRSLRAIDVVDATDTNEIVIQCERYNPY